MLLSMLACASVTPSATMLDTPLLDTAAVSCGCPFAGGWWVTEWDGDTADWMLTACGHTGCALVVEGAGAPAVDRYLINPSPEADGWTAWDSCRTSTGYECIGEVSHRRTGDELEIKGAMLPDGPHYLVAVPR